MRNILFITITADSLTVNNFSHWHKISRLYWFVKPLTCVYKSLFFFRAAEVGNVEALVKLAVAYLYNEGRKYLTMYNHSH